MRSVQTPSPDEGLSFNPWSARFVRLDALAADADLKARAQADADAARAAETRRAADHERYLHFLSLVAIHPDWLDDGKLGLKVAAHTPAGAHEAYAAWSNDHARLRSIAEVRQASLDGIHRLEPDLAAGIEQAVDRLIPRLPPPSPLRDSSGRLAPAVELAMALVAENPGWLPASGDPARLSAQASPTLVAIIGRYRSERGLPVLLATAKRHGNGVANSLEPTLARAIDRRRESIALRRARGGLHVMAPDRTRLSPAMVDHLAQACRHPEWIALGKHLGLGLTAAASPMFRQQWAAWTEPELARQLLMDALGTPGFERALTPAMWTQVQDRIQALTSRGGSRPPPGITGHEPSR